MKTRRLLAISILAALLAPAAAGAAGGPVFGLRPVGKPKLGYFVYSLASGKSQSGAVLVTNTGSARGTVRIYPADGSTGRTTGTIYMTDTKPTRAGSWIHVASPRLTLAPHSFKRVAFTVRVPAGQQAGQWVGGIVAESTEATSTKTRTTGKSGVQIKVRNQTIIAVQVDVPGPLAPSFAIGPVTTGGQGGFQDLILHVTNTGNALAKPVGSATVLKDGTPVATLPFSMDTFLPQTAIDYPILLKKALGPGTYTTRITLTYPGAGGASKTVRASPSLVVSKGDVAKVFTSAQPTKPPPGGAVASSGGSSTPWALIGAGLAALVALLLLLLWLRRWSRGNGDSTPDAAVPAERVAQAAAPAPPPHSEPAPPEPAPAEAAPIPDEPQPQQAEAPVAEPPPGPVLPPAAAGCVPHHFWDVAYERGTLGDDGVWRFPHRCRNCGLELLATDISDASAQAEALRH